MAKLSRRSGRLAWDKYLDNCSFKEQIFTFIQFRLRHKLWINKYLFTFQRLGATGIGWQQLLLGGIALPSDS